MHYHTRRGRTGGSTGAETRALAFTLRAGWLAPNGTAEGEPARRVPPGRGARCAAEASLGRPAGARTWRPYGRVNRRGNPRPRIHLARRLARLHNTAEGEPARRVSPGRGARCAAEASLGRRADPPLPCITIHFAAVRAGQPAQRTASSRSPCAPVGSPPQQSRRRASAAGVAWTSIDATASAAYHCLIFHNSCFVFHNTEREGW
jgi:hypothetical protein